MISHMQISNADILRKPRVIANVIMRMSHHIGGVIVDFALSIENHGCISIRPPSLPPPLSVSMNVIKIIDNRF